MYLINTIYISNVCSIDYQDVGGYFSENNLILVKNNIKLIIFMSLFFVSCTYSIRIIHNWYE